MGVADRLLDRPPPRAAFDALLRVRSWLGATARSLLPAEARIVERGLEAIEIRCLGLLAEWDLAGHLAEGPRYTSELAESTGTDPDALERILALMARTGWVRRDGTRWATTGQLDKLRADQDGSLRDWARFFCGSDVFAFLAAAERSAATGGSAVETVSGMSFFDWAVANPEAGALFDGAMEAGSSALARSFRALVDVPAAATICDVGGGTGALLGALLHDHPHRRGILFDLEPVVERARRRLDAAVADRVELVAGSFFDAVPSGADRYVLVSVLHDWDDRRCLRILGNIRAAMSEESRLLVTEAVLDPERPAFLAAHTDVLMLFLTGAGRERTASDFDRLFSASDLTRTGRRWTLASLHEVMELAPG